MSSLKIFALLYFISVAIMYMLFTRGGRALVFPGDLYIKRGPRSIYFPLGSAFFLSIILFILLYLLRRKILGT